MTPGEKMVWAAAFVRALDKPLVLSRAGAGREAAKAVRRARELAAEDLDLEEQRFAREALAWVPNPGTD